MAALVAALAAWFFWPRPADLRRFDPERMAFLEARMWRSYYEHRRVLLAADLYRLGREQYRFSPWSSARLAWFAARAAVVFQPTANRAEAQRALPYLKSYFAVVREDTGERFDPAVAAEEELNWWQLRRENPNWEQYAPAVSRATAIVYGTRPELTLPAARARAEMMARRDAHRDRALTDAEWAEIQAGLAASWRTLKAAVGPREAGTVRVNP